MGRSAEPGLRCGPQRRITHYAMDQSMEPVSSKDANWTQSTGHISMCSHMHMAVYPHASGMNPHARDRVSTCPYWVYSHACGMFQNLFTCNGPRHRLWLGALIVHFRQCAQFGSALWASVLNHWPQCRTIDHSAEPLTTVQNHWTQCRITRISFKSLSQPLKDWWGEKLYIY